MTPKDLIKVLEAKGFLLKRINGSHHFFNHPISGKITVVPLHKKDLQRVRFMQFLNRLVSIKTKFDYRTKDKIPEVGCGTFSLI